jgi:hypothetical protein
VAEEQVQSATSVPQPEYYQPPSNAAPLRIAAAAIISILITILAAFAYTLVVFYMPLVYANAIAGGLFGGLVGYSAIFGARQAKLLHRRSTLAIAQFAMCLGFVIAWIGWLGLVLPKSFGTLTPSQLLHDPSAITHAIAQVYESGTWSVGMGGLAKFAPPVNGPILALVWLGEAVLLFAFAIIAVNFFAITTPLCPHCRAWCTDARLLHSYSGRVSGLALKGHLEGRDWQVLGTLIAPRAAEIQLLVLTHESCPRCKQSHFLSLHRRTRSAHRGPFARSDIPVINKLVINKEELEAIAALPAVDPFSVDAQG